MNKVFHRFSLESNYYLTCSILIFLILFFQKLSAVELSCTLQKLVENKKIENLNEVKINTQYLNGQILFEVQLENQTYFFVNNKLCAYSVLSSELPLKFKGLKSIIGVDFIYFKQWHQIIFLSYKKNVFVAELDGFSVIFDQKYIENFIYLKHKNFDFAEISKIIPYCYLLKKKIYFDNIINHIEERVLKQKADTNILKNQFILSDFYSLISCIIDDEKSGVFGTVKSKTSLKKIVVPVSNSLPFKAIDYSGNINDLITILESYSKKSISEDEHFILTPLSNYIFDELSKSSELNEENAGETNLGSDKNKLLENKVGFFKHKGFKIIIANEEFEHGLSHLISDRRYFNKRNNYYNNSYLTPNWTNYPSFYSISYLKDNANSIFCIVTMRYKNKDIHALYQMISNKWKLMWFSQRSREYLDEIHWGEL